MSDESQQAGQDEIEELLKQAKAAPASAPATPPSTPAGAASVVEQDEIEALLRSAAPAAKPAKTESKAPAAEDGNKILAQSDIEALLNKTGPQVQTAKPSHVEPSPTHAMAESSMAPGDIELLLHQAERALASIDQPAGGPPPGVRPFELENFSGAPPSSETATLELIRDVELDLKIELGRTHMYLEDVLKLRRGSVVPLDKLAGDPVDIYVNGRLIARGEVLVLNDNFCVRVAELVAGETAAAG